MKRCLFAFFAAAIASLAWAADAGTWKTYTYKEDGFSASLPKTPEIHRKKRNTHAGGVTDINNYLVGFGNDGSVILSCTALTPNPRNVAQALQACRDGVLGDMKATLTSETSIKRDGNDGIEFEAKSADFHIRERAFIYRGKLFQMLSIATLARPLPTETNRIFDSFRLLADEN